MTPFLRLLAAATCTLVVAGCGGSDDDAASGPAPATTRATAYGSVEGEVDAEKGVIAWKGVPYAQPPLGALRWKPPVEPQPWTGVRQARQFGHGCSSIGSLYGPGLNDAWDPTVGATLGQPVGSEDCLYVNIWRPNTNETNLPVIVFIHGGSNVTSHGADPAFQLARVAKAANAVTVTLNYRLGVFGFFHMQQLKTGEPNNDSGNFAILDMIQVLKFVKANIASFGGDPGNVTVTGQSAGAGNLWALIVSPQTAGLMHKAAPLSGGLLSTRTPTFNAANTLYWNLLIEDARATDLASAQAYAATQTPQQVADYLRAVPGAVVMSVLARRGGNSGGAFTDGTVVPVDPYAAVAAGNYRQIPIMAGNTRDEGKLFTQALLRLGSPQLFPILYSYNAESTPPPTLTLADVILPAYLPVDTPVTGYNARAARTSLPNDASLNALKAKQSNLWAYRFDWDEEPAPWNDVYGAAHVFDVPFLFGNFDPWVFNNIIVTKANEGGRLALSKAMVASLAAFARTGDPNNAELGIAWPQWPALLLFDASKTAKTLSVKQP